MLKGSESDILNSKKWLNASFSSQKVFEKHFKHLSEYDYNITPEEYLNTEKVQIIQNGEEIMECPVCGEKVDIFDICDNCGYQNSGPKEKEGDPTGPNKMTLKEAREAYKKGEKVI